MALEEPEVGDGSGTGKTLSQRGAMTEKLVSCIVPAYNAESYLPEALESIFAQNYRPVELIVVNDGSTDGTPAVMDRYRNRIIGLNQANQGPAAARNAGLKKCQGDYIAFLDADDRWLPEKLERQMAFLEANPQSEACVTMIQNFWIPELQAEANRYRNHPISRPLPGFLTQTLLMKRSAFEKVGYLNADAGAGDATDWFLRAKDAGVKCEMIPEVLVERRLHHNNRSRGLGSLPTTVLFQFLKDSINRKNGKGKNGSES
jgi:glycosyltransferase involved in cell wall biosynthesis